MHGREEADEPAPRRQVAPGKRTLTMSLLPRSGRTPPMQQKRDAAAEPRRGEPDALTEDWAHAAL